ncbi:hypothetical protein JRO89_XS05G0251600 [Xanthoceras sorbifolium]|uniref:Uncharacterized protein n=1 Tax=Xanthoceras sorbifolium TaxID=99658 RepID=A0ABQ8I385_9ROSI|nr:hypothetical protein JRO89_XS05G0251600 [Xanthoceras sorbifolium]
MSFKVIIGSNSQQYPKPDWRIQQVSNESVYPKGIFNFKKQYSIQTTTGRISSNNEKVSIPLLDSNVIGKHKHKHRYVHIGLVQVYVTPLISTGINGSVSLFLKDKRLFDFSDSILNVPQASEIDDPINFYPNIMVSFEEIDVLHHLTLNVKLGGLEEEGNNFVLSLITKVHYKWMRDQVIKSATKCYGPGIEGMKQLSPILKTLFGGKKRLETYGNVFAIHWETSKVNQYSQDWKRTMVIGDYDLCLQEDEVTTRVYNVVATPSVLQRVKQSQWQDEELRTLWNRLINGKSSLSFHDNDEFLLESIYEEVQNRQATRQSFHKRKSKKRNRRR